MHDELIRQLQCHLTPDLLKPEFRDKSPRNPLYGHCYVASEALYHLLGGRAAGWRVHRARDEAGVVHWWLEDGEGNRLDPTAGQYVSLGRPPPYDKGKRGTWLTGERPSRRAAELIRRVGLDPVQGASSGGGSASKRR